MRRRGWASMTVLLLAAAWTPAPAEVVGVGNVGLVVADLERSVTFYRDVLDLEPDIAPTPLAESAAVARLSGVPDARARLATFRIPGSELGLELIEYRGVDRRPAHPRFQDPGAVNLQLRVRSLDTILARLPESDGRVWTPSGAPVALRETLRAILLQDPDGFFVELIEDAAPAAGAPHGEPAPEAELSSPAPDAPAPAAAAAAPTEQGGQESDLRRATALPGTEERRSFDVTVVEVRPLPRGVLFILDDGTVWTQTDTRRANLPSTPFPAEIRPGSMGSYFLTPESRRAGVRVRRTE